MSEENRNEENKDGYEKICYLCHRPESKVEKMITIPNDITICSDCMQKTFDQIGMRGMSSFGEIPGVEFINLGGPFGGLPEEMQKRHQVKTKKKNKEDVEAEKQFPVKATGEFI